MPTAQPVPGGARQVKRWAFVPQLMQYLLDDMPQAGTAKWLEAGHELKWAAVNEAVPHTSGNGIPCSSSA